MDNPKLLSPGEELQFQQLAQLRFWETRQEKIQAEIPDDQASQVNIPYRWELTRGITLHQWQEQCVEAWTVAEGKGVIKVVTGAGKTVLAMAIAERLQQTRLSQLRIAVVVPTVVLLEQWRAEFIERSNLPAEAIGLSGGGHDETFSEKIRVLISVLNSASKKLPTLVRDAGIGNSLLLIVDECHRAGAAEMQKVFQTQRAFSLGLSATPERDSDPSDDDADHSSNEFVAMPLSFEETVLGQELGPVIFELNYAEAISLGVLPPFSICHYGLNLTPQESAKYERTSREITDLRKELERPGRQGLGLIRWCRSKGAANFPAAGRLLGLTVERKRLLFRMEERSKAVVRILETTFAENPTATAILFHESIEEVVRLFQLLRSRGFSVVAEHSEFPDQMRAASLRLFRSGVARIIVSARSLIEGFNVPSADIGIIIAASSSVRQRVQTLGRLLRKSRTKDGVEKHALLHVLYAANTVDEFIYEKADWEQFIGAERNRYFLWPSVESSSPTPAEKAPRAPQPNEQSVDDSTLVPFLKFIPVSKSAINRRRFIMLENTYARYHHSANYFRFPIRRNTLLPKRSRRCSAATTLRFSGCKFWIP